MSLRKAATHQSSSTCIHVHYRDRLTMPSVFDSSLLTLRQNHLHIQRMVKRKSNSHKIWNIVSKRSLSTVVYFSLYSQRVSAGALRSIGRVSDGLYQAGVDASRTEYPAPTSRVTRDKDDSRWTWQQSYGFSSSIWMISIGIHLLGPDHQPVIGDSPNTALAGIGSARKKTSSALSALWTK